MTDQRAVFVVHGRNTPVRDSMFAFLRSLELKPLEWDTAIGLTGKASPYIGEVLDAAFEHARAVVVLMTPDEVAYLDQRWASGPGDDQANPAPQARPNVLFEAGMALGRNPENTLLVEVGSVRPFSDVGGRHAIRLSNDAASRQSFATRLRNTGLAVDPTGTDWLTIGDFTADPPGAGLPLGRRIASSASSPLPVDFGLAFHRTSGSNTFDKLKVINRGTETAFNVSLTLPSEAALELEQGSGPIEKIPGGGRSVTLDVWNKNQVLGSGDVKDAFDATVTGTTDDGTRVTQDVFLDTNG
ncbi:MAG: nucleotide-binding protein [Ornithinimicrobium sp.]